MRKFISTIDINCFSKHELNIILKHFNWFKLTITTERPNKTANYTRSYYRKESAASPPRDQRQHAEFAE